jgi:hypothetical protein
MTSHLLGTTKAKVAALTIAALVVGTPLLMQRRAVEKLSAENQTLVEELAEARREIANSAPGPMDELERLRRENAELHRLRGEVTALRRERREWEAARAAAASVAEAVEAPVPAQVTISARYAEMVPDILRELQGMGIPLPANQSSAVVLGRAQGDQLLEFFNEREGVDLLSAPKVTTVDGRQARISVGDHLVVEGQALPVGTVLDVLPEVSQDRATTTLKVEAYLTEFLGFDESGGLKIPRFRVRKAASEGTVRDGEMILLQAATQVTEDGTIPEEPRKVLILVASTVINSDGSPLVLRVE